MVEVRFDINFNDDTAATISLSPFANNASVLPNIKSTLISYNTGSYLPSPGPNLLGSIKNSNGSHIKSSKMFSNAHIITTAITTLF